MEKKIFKVRLTALTPVHIGAGLKLRRGVDFVVHNGKLHLLSPEKIWEAIGHGQYESWLKAIEHDRQEEFLRALDPSYQRFASLSIPLKFPPQGHVPSDFHRHITSPTRGAYVPGSSLKGAILTLIVYRNTREGRILIQPFMMGDWKMYNGNKVLIFDDKEIMKKIWGDNPNSSLGRFIRFSDLHAVADSENKTEVPNASLSAGRPKALSPSCRGGISKTEIS
jgi:CRISPR type III-A-associated RAMP protein Csm5